MCGLIRLLHRLQLDPLLLLKPMQCNAVQCSATQCNAIQSSAMCNMQYDSVIMTLPFWYIPDIRAILTNTVPGSSICQQIPSLGSVLSNIALQAEVMKLKNHRRMQVHHPRCITCTALPAVHHLRCITCSSSPALHHP